MIHQDSISRINEIMLRRKNALPAIDCPDGGMSMVSYKDQIWGSQFVYMLTNYGYIVSAEQLQTLTHLPENERVAYATEVKRLCEHVRDCRIARGRVLYRGFPQEVWAASDSRLFMTALAHYWSNGTMYPQSGKIADANVAVLRDFFPSIFVGNLTPITFWHEADVKELAENILTGNVAMSAQDELDVNTILNAMDGYRWNLDIPNKENAAMYNVYLLRSGAVTSPHTKTMTDLLRTLVAYSGGDRSLAAPTRFKHMGRQMRRNVLVWIQTILNGKFDQGLADMARYKNMWIRIGEILHPGEYAKRYPLAAEAFEMLRADNLPRSFASQVEAAIKENDITLAVKLLLTRPGEFARRLDHLMRTSSHEAQRRIAIAFAAVADRVSTPVLWQNWNHFTWRNDHACDPRIVFPKGKIAKAVSVPATMAEVTYASAIAGSCWNALKKKYAQLGDMGKVYIDPALQSYPIPFAQRSASSGMRTLPRGSRVKFDANYIRAFCWWTNLANGERVDIDLSCQCLDENLNTLEYIAYYNLRANGMTHSGDIVNGNSYDGNGVTEYLDIDIEKLSSKCRYIAFTVHDYSEKSFSQMEHCKFGFMELTKEEALGNQNDPKLYVPADVSQCINMTAQTTMAIPVIFDVATKEFVWCDLAGSNIPRGHANNLHSTMHGLLAAVYGILNLQKPSMYDLALCHAMSHGMWVDTPEEADLVFTTNPLIDTKGKIITQFDIDEWMKLL